MGGMKTQPPELKRFMDKKLSGEFGKFESENH